MAKTIEECVKEPGWHALDIFGPSVDEYGHEMSDGTYYEPTFKRNFKVTGLRTDGTYFEVNITLDKDVDLDLLKKVGTLLKSGLMQFETFRTCKCNVDKRCERHQ